jgi:hypothetical protein
MYSLVFELKFGVVSLFLILFASPATLKIRMIIEERRFEQTVSYPLILVELSLTRSDI